MLAMPTGYAVYAGCLYWLSWLAMLFMLTVYFGWLNCLCYLARLDNVVGFLFVLAAYAVYGGCLS
jgi:hypothetical protein